MNEWMNEWTNCTSPRTRIPTFTMNISGQMKILMWIQSHHWQWQFSINLWAGILGNCLTVHHIVLAWVSGHNFLWTHGNRQLCALQYKSSHVAKHYNIMVVKCVNSCPKIVLDAGLVTDMKPQFHGLHAHLTSILLKFSVRIFQN
jgi:hypothetical protein